MSKWSISFTKKSQKELQKLDKVVQIEIVTALERVLKLDDPRDVGRSLTGEFSSLWRYRVGYYRIIAKLEDNICTIIVVRIVHRK